MSPLALATSKSHNRKTGTAAVTYAAQGSCPASCRFLGAGCYAEGGGIGHITRRLNAEGRRASPVEIAEAEAHAIDYCEIQFAGQAMRLHSVGDCSTEKAARIVAGAAARWRARGGGPVWTYTHAWRMVPREAWHPISVLASCETPGDVFAARVRGYATAMVVEEFQRDTRYPIAGEGTIVELVPCPAQTRHVPCTDCGLCLDDELRYDAGVTIGFALHGDRGTMRQAVGTIRGEPRPKLRDVIPEMVSQGLTGAEIAQATGTSPSSVYEMTGRLRDEGVIP